MGVALGALTVWHAVLISKGETSIERHMNKKERQRLAAWGKVTGLESVFSTVKKYFPLDSLCLFLT